MNRIQFVGPLVAVVMALAVVGCSKSGNEAAPSGAPAEVPSALTAVFADVPAAEGLKSIPELRQTAKPGDEVVLEVKVMGAKDPFVENRALFVVGDEGTLISCDVRHEDDACKTPWDACCDDAAALRAGTATIQVLGDDGQVLRHSIKGVSGLKELSRLRIAGVVAPNSTESAFIINATTIQML